MFKDADPTNNNNWKEYRKQLNIIRTGIEIFKRIISFQRKFINRTRYNPEHWIGKKYILSLYPMEFQKIDY